MYSKSGGGLGMKRDRSDSGRDSPNMMSMSGSSKRSRSGAGGGTLGRYDMGHRGDSSDEEGGSPHSRRHHHSSHHRSGSRGGSPGHRNSSRGVSPPGGYAQSRSRSGAYYQDDYKRPPAPAPAASGSSPYPYKVLCVSSLHSKASDEVIRDTLYRDFRRFGDISVKVVQEPDERVAYVYFRSYEDARDAKHSKSRNQIIIYDKPVIIEPAYETSSSSSYNESRPRATSPYHRGGGGGGMDSYGGSGGYYNNRRGSPHGGYDGRGDRRDRDHHMGGMHAPPPHDNGSYGGGRYNDRYNNPPHQPMHYRQNAPRDYNHPGGGDYRPYNRYAPSNGPMSHRGGHGHHGPMDHGGQMNRMGGGPMGGRMHNEGKKDKFPNYLQHIPPEEDPLATRTLFAGNLEVNIADEELRRIFMRYGTVEDIDIKRPPPGTGNAYAFVRFQNLDMAARAKAELSGQYIGKFQCKIGYGKVNPTTKIWIGGLGSWTTMSMLETEFDRFGSIKKIDWAKGENQAYITYETIDAAQAAVNDMRGYPLGGPDKRLRLDFADASSPPINITGYPSNQSRRNDYDNFDKNSGGNATQDFVEGNHAYGRSTSRTGSAKREDDMGDRGSLQSPTGTDIASATSPGSNDSLTEGSRGLSSCKTVHDITKKAQVGWHGALILKNSSFPCKLHMLEGDLDGIETLMKDDDGKNVLRITQRLRLEKSKLDDVLRRIGTAPSHGVFLGFPSSSSSEQNSPAAENSTPGGSVQSRPLKNLVSYLQEKEAAGVISLHGAGKTAADPASGVLYAFPPCSFSIDLIKRNCPSFNFDPAAVDKYAVMDRCLVVVVIRGGGPNSGTGGN